GMVPEALEKKSEGQYLKTRRKILDILIEEKIAREKIQELKIKVPQKEVDATIERVKTDNNLTQKDLVAALKEQGQSYDQYRKMLKTELERRRLVNYEVRSKIIIREGEIKEYYAAHKDEFSTKGKVHLAMIFLKQEDPADREESRALEAKASRIIQKIKASEDFGKLARQFSDGPGAKEGGDLGAFKVSELNPEMATTIKDLSSGEVGAPIVGPNGIQIIKVVEKDKGGEKSFDQVENSIRSTLYRKKMDQAYSAWIRNLRDRAYVKIIF
ncbi:MAG: peptidylprolyl isomerase, partial [Deltaproteobacteria bacterium]|nr:peptidylprolyl isomerase [Deltaproteobacteria bacterium]